jgi:sugar phosphate permease
VGGGSAAAVLFAGFAWRQTTADKPLLPPRILRSPLTSLANLVMALMVAGMFGFQFLGSLYLQQVLSFDPIGTGLGILPVALVIGFFSLFLTARLIARFDTQPVLLSGLALIVAGLALLSRALLDAIYLVDLLPVMLLLGAGFGMAMPALASLAMSHIAPEDSGLGSGLFNTAQQIGGALGLAILATLAALRVDITLAQGREALSALAAGYGYAFGAAAGLVALATLIAATFLRTASARAVDRMVSKE